MSGGGTPGESGPPAGNSVAVPGPGWHPRTDRPGAGDAGRAEGGTFDACARCVLHAALPDRPPEEHHPCPILPSAAASGDLTTTNLPLPSAAGTALRCPPWTPSTRSTACPRGTAGPPGTSPPRASAAPDPTRAGWSPT